MSYRKLSPIRYFGERHRLIRDTNTSIPAGEVLDICFDAEEFFAIDVLIENSGENPC